MVSENLSSGAAIKAYIDERFATLKSHHDANLLKIEDGIEKRFGSSLDHRLDVRIGKSESMLKEYATKKSDAARNQAIGVLAFAALLLSIGGAIGINSIIGQAIQEAGVGYAIAEAESSRDRAVSAAESAEEAIREIDSTVAAAIRASGVDAAVAEVLAAGDLAEASARKAILAAESVEQVLADAKAVRSDFSNLEANLAREVSELNASLASKKAPEFKVVQKPYSCDGNVNQVLIACPDGFSNTGGILYNTWPGGPCGYGQVLNICAKY